MGTIYLSDTHIIAEIIDSPFFGTVDIGKEIEIVPLFYQISLL